MDYEKIKLDKIKEDEELYKNISIDLNDKSYIDSDNYFEIPEVHETTEKKDDVVFHWTRLSNNSNIGCITE